MKIKLFTRIEKEHSEDFYRRIAFFNKFSLIFHALLSFGIVFLVEVISRRSFTSACSFVSGHTGAYVYNAFIVFASLSLVYLFRRRAFLRIIISGFWIILGVINGCILSNRVTPFGFTDLKCIPDLFAMNNTNYFTAEEATLVVLGMGIFVFFCTVFFIKGPRYEGHIRKLIVLCSTAAVIFVGVPVTTSAAQKSNVVASYFSNIAQGYENYGFIYGFSSSVVDRGMDKPDEYSEEEIDEITAKVEEEKEDTTVTSEDAPNVICVLLESFCDPDEINFLDVNEDPIPTFHELEENYTSGYLTVPVVGAGTANSEFEVLTGMSMQYFGTGEYPYKTILKKTDCESIASDLAAIGYGTHAVHNNGGNFYSRVNAFSMMGFDTFTSKELMDIRTFTPNGSWATDDILVNETIKTLDATPDQPDFTYTITVGTHGDYPTEAVIEDPTYTVTGAADEETTNQWTYYVNQLHESDRFISRLIDKLSSRDEDTIVVFFGDHLPTMGLTDEDMKSGDIYKTKYITWNNMGLEKNDADLYAYQLLASITDSVGIHEGTILSYHQTQMDSDNETYLSGLDALQYDILYGSRYCYDGADKYPATEIVMGIDDVVLDEITTPGDELLARLAAEQDAASVEEENENEEAGASDSKADDASDGDSDSDDDATENGYSSEELAERFADKLLIRGSSFTKWSRVFINGQKVSTTYINSRTLLFDASKLEDGDTVCVSQLGSNNTVFRSSNDYVYAAPEAADSTEIETDTEETE
jgi:phosphoglycerol transferase MdoB-like AlkP superfamily enzyme